MVIYSTIHIWSFAFRIGQILILLFSITTATASIPEKFYAHLNQPVYLTGETIWFKVYNTNYHELADHSNIIYLNQIVSPVR